ncbi:uncharacterized protein VDAG_05426 [Verticillium dahliae VdLs.17]|uniref:Uncharacterized protein n=1 Tax=Verticillium dahliae (strain VdLs.17 / ATCC MYA-4575 / FGSC 10137) TaxID=498257 RepID=G2X5C1_VERDV|nr:uncharacterized protein VDAG_05426 [Verticillium dahliae VdLs.17]EGY14262.1 hypothetical protein VDAG_05426 [Verticillium dahliae VdLs.17]
MSSKKKYKIYIAVHKGDPIDFSKYRHTGLWCMPEDRYSHYYFYVKGLTGDFTFERQEYDKGVNGMIDATMEAEDEHLG